MLAYEAAHPRRLRLRDVSVSARLPDALDDGRQVLLDLALEALEIERGGRTHLGHGLRTLVAFELEDATAGPLRQHDIRAHAGRTAAPRVDDSAGEHHQPRAGDGVLPSASSGGTHPGGASRATSPSG